MISVGDEVKEVEGVLPEVLKRDNVSSDVGVKKEYYDITALEPKQQRFIHTYLTGQYKLVDIAELLNVHVSTVSAWMRKKEIQWLIQDYQKAEHEIVASSLKALQLKAVNKMSDLIDSPIDGIAYQASKDVLDRGGHKPQQNIKVDKTVVTFEKKLNDLIAGVMGEEDIIDVEGIEVKE